MKNRRDFARSQLSELQNSNADAWAKESFEIVMKIAYWNRGDWASQKWKQGLSRGSSRSVLPAGYVINASLIAGQRDSGGDTGW